MASAGRKPIVGADQQIPRNSLALLMIAQVVVTLPLAQHISLWIVAVGLSCGYWRMQVYRGRWGYPPGWVKFLLVVAACTGLALSGYVTYSLEAATSLLVLAFALKLLEMRSRRDAYLVIFLSYFLVANAFLFDQTMALAAYEMLAMVVVTAAVVGMNQMQARVRPLASMKTAAALVLQALPLTIVLFLLFPRVGPIWSIPLPSSASTGISEKMSPGDVANLSQSDELAFRAVFAGDAPPLHQDLYWRGLVYADFREGEWQVGPTMGELEEARDQRRGAVPEGAFEYAVFLEPTQNRWLFTLDTPVRFPADAALLGDYRLLADEPVLSLEVYRVVSDSSKVLDDALDGPVRTRNLAFDPRDNLRLQAYARELKAQTDSEQAFIDRMLADIREQPYRYTLSPPVLREPNSIDAFWFDARAGFCAHYAGAMVMALRMAGIPARMVGGYQGGEVNPVTGHVVVRQYQAHAWVEAWLDGRGWQRIDPTAAVAPERVEQGLDAALSSQDRESLSFLSAARIGGTGALTGLLIWADSLEHRWNLWVVGYDKATQEGVLGDWLGGITPARIGLAMLVGGGLSLLLVSVAVLWRRRGVRSHPLERGLRALSRGLARQGLDRQAGETPTAYLTRLCTLAKEDPQPLTEAVTAALYDPEQTVEWRNSWRLQQALRRLRFKLVLQRARGAT